MVYSARSDAATRSQFTRRKKVTITTGGTSTPTDYQVKLTIIYEPGMQANFDDIRFNTLSIGYIDYWIESYVASISAVVWVELPDAITNPGSDIILMYYGNPNLSNGSVGADTFLQYHGYANAEFIDSLNTQYSNVIYEADAKQVTAGYLVWGLGTVADRAGDGLQISSYGTGDTRNIFSLDNGTLSYNSENPDFTDDVWYRLKITNDGTWVKGYVDGDIIDVGVNTNLPDTNLGLTMYVYSDFGGTFEQNWSFSRKYIVNEPTPSYGTAQHQRRTPQFIG